MTEELKSYKIAIENLANKKDGTYFTNSGKEHAAIVMSNIFKSTDSHIRIFAKNLSGEVCDQDLYIDGLQQFINRKGEIEIILTEEPSSDSKAFKLIKEYQICNPEKVNIKKTATNISNLPELKFHFTVGDERIFRLEKDTSKYLAVCSFNDNEYSKKLISLFKRITSSSVSYSLV
jgi:hypothetical protein